jgi:hypothetical protein
MWPKPRENLTLREIRYQSNRLSGSSLLKLKVPNSPRIFLSLQVRRGSTLISYATSLERGNELASTLFFPISALEAGRDNFGRCLGCVICLRFELLVSWQRSWALSPEWIIKFHQKAQRLLNIIISLLWMHTCTSWFLSAKQVIIFGRQAIKQLESQ